MADFAARRTTMVDTQVRPSDVTKFPIIDAMLAVPKEVFVPELQRDTAYVGENIDIGDDRVILAPRSFGKLLDAVDIQASDVVLDIGCGLGYSSAVIARIADAVVAVENGSTAERAQEILVENDADNVAVISGDLAGGAAKHGPYDVILIEGGVETIPLELTDQLNEGGRIGAIFMEGALGICRVGHKIDGQMYWRDSFNASAPVLAEFSKVPVFAL